MIHKTYASTCVISLFCLCWTGVDNFYDAVEDMIGYRPNPWMKWSWTIITPVLCMVRAQSVHCVGEFRDTVVDDVANIEYCHTKVTARCMTYCVLKASCVCFLGLLCLFSGEVQALDL